MVVVLVFENGYEDEYDSHHSHQPCVGKHLYGQIGEKILFCHNQNDTVTHRNNQQPNCLQH